MSILKFLAAAAIVGPCSAGAHSSVGAPATSPKTFESAQIEIECELLIKSLPGLPRSETMQYDIELHEAAGFIVGRGEKIPDLESGFYLWQVWRTGDLAIVPRYNFERYMATKNDEFRKGVNTHEAFDLLFQEKYGRPITDEVLASGEGRAAFGEFFYLNNKSGKRIGPDETLNAGQRVLRSRGARLTESTTIEYMDRTRPEHRGHAPADRRYDEWQLHLMESVLSQPEGATLFKLYERLGRVLRPYTSLAWDCDVADMLGFRVCNKVFPQRMGGVRDLNLLVATLLRGTPLFEPAFPIFYVFIHGTNTDGIYYAIQSDWHQISTGNRPAGDYVKFVAPKLIDFLLQKLGGMMPESDRLELKSISAGFAALPARSKAVDEASEMKAVERPNLDFEVKPDAPTKP